MKISIKQTPTGKPASDYPKNKLTYGWLAVDFTPAKLIAHIESGKPFAIAQYKRGHRRSDNFIASDLIALDIDGVGGQPMTAAQYHTLLNDPFIANNAFAVIQSASSQLGAHKARVLFQLDQTITDPKRYKQVVMAIMAKMPIADPACKDAARFFYGGQPNRAADFIADNILPVPEMPVVSKRPVRASIPFKPNHQYAPNDERTMVELALTHLPDSMLSYDEWLSVLIALSTVPYGLELAEQWTNDQQIGLAEKFKSFTQHSVTLGSLFYLAQQHGFRFPKRQDQHLISLNTLALAPEDTPNPYPNGSLLINGRYLNQVLGRLDHPVVAIQSPIGTGKTEWVIEHLRDKSFLFVLPRRALCSNMVARLKKAGVEVAAYDEMDFTSDIPKRLVITYNSLYKLFQKGQYPKFDVIILDESEQGVDHLAGRTFEKGEAKNAYYLLKALIHQAGQVIALDAHMGQLTLTLLENSRPEPVTWVINRYQMERGEMVVLPTARHAARLALDHAKQGGKIAIACDTPRRATLMDQQLRRLGIATLCITGENSSQASITHCLKDITSAVDAAQVFIYTSAVGTGVDIQSEIDTVYACFDNQSITPQEQLQLIGRCRRANQVVVGSNQIERDQITKPDDLYNDYVANLGHLIRLGIELIFSNNQGHLSPHHAEFLHLICQIEAKRNAAMNTPRGLFINLAKKEYRVRIDRAEKIPQEVRAAELAIQREIEEEQKSLVLNTPVAAENTYKNAKHQGESTPEMEAGYRRSIIEGFYQQPIDGIIYDHAKQGGMGQISRFILLHSDISNAIKNDQVEVYTKVDIHQMNFTAPQIETAKILLAIIFPNGLHNEKIQTKDLKKLLLTFEAKWEQLNGNRVFGRSIGRGKSARGKLQGLLKLFGLTFIQRRSNGIGYYRLGGLEEMRAYAAGHLRQQGAATQGAGETPNEQGRFLTGHLLLFTKNNTKSDLYPPPDDTDQATLDEVPFDPSVVPPPSIDFSIK